MADAVTAQPDELVAQLVAAGARCGDRAGCAVACTLPAGAELCVHVADDRPTGGGSLAPGCIALAFVVAVGLWTCRRR